MIDEETLRKYLYEAAKLTIEMNSWIPFDVYLQNLAATGGTVEYLTSQRLEPGFFYIVNVMGAYEEGTAVSNNVSLGYISGSFYHIVFRSKPAEDLMATWTGQIILREGDQLQASFANTTASDKLYFFANGYKIPLSVLLE